MLDKALFHGKRHPQETVPFPRRTQCWVATCPATRRVRISCHNVCRRPTRSRGKLPLE